MQLTKKRMLGLALLTLLTVTRVFALDTTTVVFQQGLNGYDGWEDTYIRVHDNKPEPGDHSKEETLELYTHTTHSS